MLDDDSDDRLGSRLDSALHTVLDVDRVDIQTLVQGSRRRARRIRTQRIAAMTVTAGLVLGVPVGYEVINPGAGGDATTAVMLPSAPARTRAGGPIDRSNPAPTAVPSAVVPSATGSAAPSNGVPPTVPDPITVAPTSIPDGFAFAPADLPAGLVRDPASRKATAALVDGQNCDPSSQGPRPAVSRQWVWADDQGQGDELSVSLTVSGWEPAEAATAFTAAVDETGYCRWEEPQQSRIRLGVSADQVWASTSELDGQHFARVVVRVGAEIAGIQVRHPKGSGAATKLADRLAQIEVSRLRNGNLKPS